MNGIAFEVEAGGTVEVEICPVGDFENVAEDGSRTVQRCDETALRRVADAFDAPVLVDFDHSSDGGDSTEAAAWIESLAFDPERGLLGVFKFTDKGALSVSGRRYRFVSPVWEVDAQGRPLKLLRCALTNRPQIRGGKPILNSARTGEPPGVFPETEKKGHPKMDELKKLLGLAAEASEEDVVKAVAALKDAAEKAESDRKEAEAEAFANAEAGDDEAKEALKNAYKAAPEATRALVNAMKAKNAAPAKPLLNSMGRTPELKTAKSAAQLREEMAALPPAARAKFYADHKNEL